MINEEVKTTESWDVLHKHIEWIEEIDPNEFEDRLSEFADKKRFSVSIDRNCCFIFLETSFGPNEILSIIGNTKKEAVVEALNCFSTFYKYLTIEESILS